MTCGPSHAHRPASDMKRSSEEPTVPRSTVRPAKHLPLAVLCLLCACTVGPNYVKPSAVEMPVAFKGAELWKHAQPQDGVIRDKWWEIFQDPALDALAERIEISNQSLAAAEARFRQARALVQVARSGYFPTVSAGASASRYRNSQNVPANTPSFVGPNSNFALAFDATWEPDIWGRVRRLVESSKAAAQASAADVEAVRLSMQAELAMDYFQLRGVDADRQLLDATIVAYQKALDLTQSLYKGGAASYADVAQAEAQLKSTQAQAIDLGVQRAQLENAIAVLVGKPASTFSIPVAPLAATPPPVPVGVPSHLLERRPDVAGAERRVASANAQIGVAIAAYYPNITLSAVGGLQASSPSTWLEWPSRFWSLGPAALTQTVLRRRPAQRPDGPGARGLRRDRRFLSADGAGKLSGRRRQPRGARHSGAGSPRAGPGRHRRPAIGCVDHGPIQGRHRQLSERGDRAGFRARRREDCSEHRFTQDDGQRAAGQGGGRRLERIEPAFGCCLVKARRPCEADRIGIHRKRHGECSALKGRPEWEGISNALAFSARAESARSAAAPPRFAACAPVASSW